MSWLRAFAVWVLLMSGEVVHGVARTLLLAPSVGDFRARQLAVFSGSLLILLITSLTIRWLQTTATRWLVSMGVKGEWLLGASGVLSLLFGGLVAAQSGAGGVALVWIIGGYAIVSGALLLALALNIRSWRQVLPAPAIV